MATMYRVLADTLTTTKRNTVVKGDEIPDSWLPKDNIESLLADKVIEEVKPEKPVKPAKDDQK